jgi:hypothetical protein
MVHSRLPPNTTGAVTFEKVEFAKSTQGAGKDSTQMTQKRTKIVSIESQLQE